MSVMNTQYLLLALWHNRKNPYNPNATWVQVAPPLTVLNTPDSPLALWRLAALAVGTTLTDLSVIKVIRVRVIRVTRTIALLGLLRLFG
jgi:hypothetical protein